MSKNNHHLYNLINGGRPVSDERSIHQKIKKYGCAKRPRFVHVGGNAIVIQSKKIINNNDAIIDLIALNFGLVRCAKGEQWHFECTDLAVSTEEQEL